MDKIKIHDTVVILSDQGELPVGTVSTVLCVADTGEYPIEVAGSFKCYSSEELQLVAG